MTRPTLPALATAGLVGLGASLAAVLAGCGRADVPEEPERAVVYVDARSLRTVVLPRDVGPQAPHPDTGQPTLVRGMYCVKCGKWYPAPTGPGAPRPEAVRCREHGLPMTLVGPLVEDPGQEAKR